jgi:CRP-like cAMP-binding protein
MKDPFIEISELQKTKLLKLLATHIYNFNKNENIIQVLNNTNFIGIILEGYAKIININYMGEENLSQELFPNSVFGTNISGIDNTECQIVVVDEPTKVLIIDYDKIINMENTNHVYFNRFLLNIFDIINSKFKETNDRLYILTKKTIRDRLLAFFETEYRKDRNLNLYLPYTLKDLSDYLSVNRSAMFRELRSLKDENFIKIKGNHITLLYRPSI